MAFVPKDLKIPDVNRRHGARLPHWTYDNAVYFVTFRLADSLPQSTLLAIQWEREALINSLRKSTRPPAQWELDAVRRLFNQKVEDYLDSGAGSCVLGFPHVADCLKTTLFYYHLVRYGIHVWCIMPNHVHVLVEPYDSGPDCLSKIMHSWKSFSSNAINKLLGKRGKLWQPESYDHILRDEADYRRAEEYVLQNPVKAGLVDWQWVGRTDLRW